MTIKMSLVISSEFERTELFSVTINGKPWTRARDIRNALEYSENTRTARVVTDNCSPKNYAHQCELVNVVSVTTSINWPSDTRKDEYYVNEEAVYEWIFSSDQPKAKKFKKYACNIMFPKIRKRLAKMIEDQHQLAIEERQTTIALLTDDVEEQQQQIANLEQDNLELQHQVQELQRRAVPQLEDNSKMNSIAVIQKNNGDDFPYVAICGQQGYVAQKIRNKLTDYPDGQLVVLGETGNAIVHYNWLRERGCIKVNPERVRHFRLGEHYTHQRLLELQDA